MIYCTDCKQQIKGNKNRKFKILHLRNRDIKMYSHQICKKSENKENVFTRLQTVWCGNKKYLYDNKTKTIYYWRKEIFNFHHPSEDFQGEIKKKMKMYDKELILKTTMDLYHKYSNITNNSKKKKCILEIFDFLARNKDFLEDNQDYTYGIKQKICYFYFIDEWTEIGKVYQKLFNVHLTLEEINLHLSYTNPEIYFEDPKKYKKSGFLMIPVWYKNKLDYDITKKKKNLVNNTLLNFNQSINNHFSKDYKFIFSHDDKSKYGSNYLFTAMLPKFVSIKVDTPKKYICEKNIFLKKGNEYFVILDLHQFYKFKVNEEKKEKICGICMSEIENVGIKLPCNHVFCKSKEWECFGIEYCYLLDKYNFKCPYCRKPIKF
jgi:hypothetical protein